MPSIAGTVVIPEDIAEAIGRVEIWKRATLRAVGCAELGDGASEEAIAQRHREALDGVAAFEDAIGIVLGWPLQPPTRSDEHMTLAKPMAREVVAKLLGATLTPKKVGHESSS